MESFAAAPGWDAVTGLGTPNFEIISRIVLNQQAVAYSSLLHSKSAAHSENIATYGSSSMDAIGSSAQQQQQQQQSVDTASLAIAGVVLGCVSTLLAAVGLFIAFRGQKSSVRGGDGGKQVHYEPHQQQQQQEQQYGRTGVQFKLSAASSFLLDESA